MRDVAERWRRFHKSLHPLRYHAALACSAATLASSSFCSLSMRTRLRFLTSNLTVRSCSPGVNSSQLEILDNVLPVNNTSAYTIDLPHRN